MSLTVSKPIAVCISDIHFNINTLPLASKALRAALSKAEELNVTLVIAGDLHDTKAIIRAEVANEIIDIFSKARQPIYCLVGNHDLVNERGYEHGLNYLKPYARVIDNTNEETQIAFIPYQTNSSKIKDILNQQNYRTHKLLIMHQGFLGAHLGDYVQDKTSIHPDVVKDYTVISGHYHRHQTIGTITYIGSPYTMSFGEANDGPKGFLILNEDGTFTREILNLRKHVILEREVTSVLEPTKNINPEDLLWLKVSGTYEQLKKLNKKEIGEKLLGHSNYKLDLIYQDSRPLESKTDVMTGEEILDSLIDSTGERVTELKSLWREII